MNQEEFRQLCALAEKRNEKNQAWLRQLLMIASAALTALVTFRTGDQSIGLSLWCLRTGWVALGLGILLGAFSLHGEVWTTSEIARLAGEAAKTRCSGPLGSSTSGPIPIFCTLPKRYQIAQTGFYGCLMLAVLALVSHAVLR